MFAPMMRPYHFIKIVGYPLLSRGGGKDVEQCEKYLSWNGHGFDIGDDVREAQLGATQKLVLELIRESPRCMQKHIVDTIGKDQGQVAKAIDRLIEVGLVIKKEGRLMAQ